MTPALDALLAAATADAASGPSDPPRIAPRLAAMLRVAVEAATDPIVWASDLSDDCTATWRGMNAHAECLDVSRPDDPESSDSWYCSVWAAHPPRSAEELFHSGSDGIHPNSGAAARRLCEMILREFAVRHALARIESMAKGEG